MTNAKTKNFLGNMNIEKSTEKVTPLRGKMEFVQEKKKPVSKVQLNTRIDPKIIIKLQKFKESYRTKMGIPEHKDVNNGLIVEYALTMLLSSETLQNLNKVEAVYRKENSIPAHEEIDDNVIVEYAVNEFAGKHI